MKRILAALLSFSSCMACAESEDSGTSDFKSSNQYAVGHDFGFHETLDMRMSLISTDADRRMFVLHGASEPVLLGLSSFRHQHTIDGNKYKYFAPEKVLRFQLGSIIGTSYYYAEALHYETKTPVGYVYFGASRDNYPNKPYTMSQICSGAYETVCTLSFNEETGLFQIKLRDDVAAPED